MKSLRVWLLRFAGLFQKQGRDRDLVVELESHVQMHVEDNLRAGMPPEEARRQALLKLGGIEQTKEIYRDRRGLPGLDAFLQDVRFGLRMLRKYPGFTVVAIVTLAFGIGATTTMFAVISGVLLKPLAYPQPERLVAVHEKTEKYGDQWEFSYPDFVDLERESRSLAPVAAWGYGGGTVGESGQGEYVDGFQISSSLFSALRVSPLQGRAFLPEDDRSGARPVAIISYGLWQRRYGGNSAAVGMPLVFEGKSYAIVGIAPPGLRISGEVADVFTPLGQNTDPRMRNRAARFIHVLARLRPDVTLAGAQADLTLLGGQLAKQYPQTEAGQSLVALPLRQELVGEVRSTLWLLLGAVSLVLLIAVVNVASLLLARAVSRERELAIRMALGASRARLARQCVAESGVLALCGGALGVLGAAIGVRPFLFFWPGSLPRAQEIHLDWRVLLFALAVSLLSGILFGAAPALRAPGTELEQVLRAESWTTKGGSRRLHSGFVASQVALAVVLLFSAGVLGRTLLRLSSLNPGVDVRNVLTARVAMSPGIVSDPAQVRAAWQDFVDRARGVPGVQSVALVDTVPMREGFNPLPYRTTPAPPPPNQMPIALASCVTPDYLKVMHIPLYSGRFFTDQDRMGSEQVVVIDDVLARHAFGTKDPVGSRIWIPATGTGPAEVIGVVGHVRYWGLANDDQSLVRDQVYYPFAQVPDVLMRLFSTLMSVAVRTDTSPLSVVGALQQGMRGSTGGEALYEIRTMEQLASTSIAGQRFLLLLFGIFVGLALLLASIGIYGVLSYLMNRRVPEIGVRMALGSTAGGVMRLVFRQSLGIVAVGVSVGVAAAFAAGRLLQGSVPGIRSNDPMAFVIAISILVIAALLASLLPAWRASRVDPTVALRHE